QADIIALHVLVLLAAESHSVHRNVSAAQGGDGIEIDSAGIIGAIAQQDHSPDRQVRGFVRQLLETISNAGYWRRRVELVQAVHAIQLAVHAVKPRLESLLQIRKHAALESLDGLCLTRAAAFCD